MSYLDYGREKSGLPAINSARRIKVLEEELAAYRLRDATTGRLSPLMSGSVTIQNQTDSRRAINELQDQLKSYREELRKKDSLIQNLVSIDSAHIPKPPDSFKLDSFYVTDRPGVEVARTELATVQVKYDRAQIQIKELEKDNEAKDIRIKELQHLQESSRDNEMRLSEMISTLKSRLSEYESRAGSYEAVANKGEITIATLQRDYREASDKIAELESRLRSQLESKEQVEARLNSEVRRITDFLSQLGSLIYCDELLDLSPTSVDVVVKKFTDIVQENATLKGKLLTLTENLNETSLESKASRETIMRLVSEVGREQKAATRYSEALENIRLERETAMSGRKDLEREISLMQERLDSAHKSMETMRKEIELRDSRLENMDQDFRVKLSENHGVSQRFDLFRESMASVLSILFTDIVPTEDCLLDTLKRLANDKRDLDLRVEDYEKRVESLTGQLEKELDIHRDMAARAKRYEVDAGDLAERLRSAEGELAAGDVLRDGFKFDKEKYLRGLQKLGEIMKMDRISLDLGLDLTMDALVARAEQLIKLEADALAEKSSSVYNLQRKIKALREQLESKDLHIDLLRKKMTSIEERLHGKVDVEKRLETDTLRVHKLEKLIEKYKLQLADSRQEIKNLKAQLLGSGDLKVHTLEQRRDIEELSRQIEELESVRKRQQEKIHQLRSAVEKSDANYGEKHQASENAVQALSSELRTTKTALDQLKYREKQLLDFRSVVARMLGLEIDTLAVPDYEIISRLEKLIQAHHTTAFTTMALEDALDESQIDSGRFHLSMQPTQPVVSRSRDRSRRRRIRTRARSLSPDKIRRDPRVY